MGTKEDNPEEKRLEMPQGMEAETIHDPADYDFAYGRPGQKVRLHRNESAPLSLLRVHRMQGAQLCKAWGGQAQDCAWVKGIELIFTI